MLRGATTTRHLSHEYTHIWLNNDVLCSAYEVHAPVILRCPQTKASPLHVSLSSLSVNPAAFVPPDSSAAASNQDKSRKRGIFSRKL